MRTKSASLALIAAALLRAQQTPDATALFKRVQEHQHKMDELRENYTLREIVRVDELDSHDAVTKSTSTERELFFVNGRRVARLIRRNGADLNPQEQKREQARVDAIVKNRMKSAPAYGKGGNVRLISEVLAVAKVSPARRVSLKDRSTLAFDFTRDPKAHAQGFEQNAAKKLAGTIWIDEADLQVARLEVRFDDNFRIGGGLLASIQKGTTIEVEQSPIADGLWLQTASDQHVAARVVVKGLRQNIHVQDLDFKKFDVGVLQKIDQPAR